MKNKFQYLLLILFIGFLSACDSGDDDDHYSPPARTTVFDVASSNADFETLVAALEATGLDETLDNPNSTFTVFAPTDAAFALLGEDTTNALLQDTEALSKILLYHVIAGSELKSNAALAAAGTTVATANGAPLGLSLSGNNLLVNLSTVTMVDIEADNGVIHVIDAVLLPPQEKGQPQNNIVETAIAAEEFTTLVAAVEAAGLTTLLADESKKFTVFAPTDAAFSVLGEETLDAILADTEVLTALLTQHVVQGTEINSVAAYASNGKTITTAGGEDISVAISNNKELLIGGAKVVTKDIYASNGIIHVIDAVIVGDLELPGPSQSIVDVAVAAGSFTTLVAALQATGLDETLANLDSTFTVFAPTDAAFSALGQESINALLADPETLANILLYHVIADAEIRADAAIGVANAEDSFVNMGNGDKTALSVNGGQLFVNLAKVTGANVVASNGVIHVIDKVMLPPAAVIQAENNIIETAIAAGSFNTLVAAVQAAGLDTVLADETKTFTVFAPTDAAFEKLGTEAINALLADIPSLSQVLLHHVIADVAVDSLTAFTLNGGSTQTAAELPVAIEIVDGKLVIEGAAVTTFNIYTSNGIIHVLDTVITSSLE